MRIDKRIIIDQAEYDEKDHPTFIVFKHTDAEDVIMTICKTKQNDKKYTTNAKIPLSELKRIIEEFGKIA